MAEASAASAEAFRCRPAYFLGGFAFVGWYVFLFGGPQASAPGAVSNLAPTAIASAATSTQNVLSGGEAGQDILGPRVSLGQSALVQQPLLRNPEPITSLGQRSSEQSRPRSVAPAPPPYRAPPPPPPPPAKAFHQFGSNGEDELFERLKPVPGGRPTRFVYLDMGSNWANTLRLHFDIMPEAYRDEPWEVYSFEANPYIQPYVDKYANWLNGRGRKPDILVPPAGSSGHLGLFAPKFGCSYERDRMMACMDKVFSRRIKALQVNEQLMSKSVIDERLAEARTPAVARGKTRYTFVPAAVGGKGGHFPLSEASAKGVIIRGARPGDAAGRKFKIPIVNVVNWLMENFQESDYILAKMDVEGAEHDIVRRLIREGKFGLIDVLMMECHGKKICPGLLQKMDEQRDKPLFLQEGRGYRSLDSWNKPEDNMPIPLD
eukprot:TRINITY_DN34156_c0_g2_i1.p1 TRINITY_DN34156_c0_g2~~TRINITY_DN34156_c0_g2_i1.p1  ORF type:complete len:433 (+),score=67.34 TRINITY_DN34156_c0_g2_i1:60-1358(+)